MPWAVLGESVIGTSHRDRNTPCQDAFRFRLFRPGDEWLVVAVADGAGSAAHAEIGATLACDEFVRRVEAFGPETLSTHEAMAALFADVRTALVTEAERRSVTPRDLACTALLAVAGPSSAMVAQLGDGAVVLGDGRGHRTVFWPEPAEYANATDFLTDDEFAGAMRFEAIADPVSELALLTDGLQRLALDYAVRMPHPPFFGPLFAAVRAAPDPEPLVEPFRGFLDSPRVNERTDDDKTLVIAVRRP
jgi:Protein phosphatase 2C